GEAQLALARCLERYPRGLGRFGSGARRARRERDQARERASLLGSESDGPARRRPSGEELLRGALVVAPALLMMIDLWWGLAALVGVHTVLVLVVLLANRRHGGRPLQRLQAARAVAHEEWDTDRVQRQLTAVGAVGALPLVAFATTGLAAAYGAEGRPWPLPGVLGVALLSVGLLAAVGAGVRWWYGSRFLREAVLPPTPVGWQPAV
ncbi:hypothetical protein, partial [Streptomyces sparsus]